MTPREWHERATRVLSALQHREREPLWDLSLLEQQGTKSTWFELCAECYRTLYSIHPTPTPTVSRPPESTSSAVSSLAV